MRSVRVKFFLVFFAILFSFQGAYLILNNYYLERIFIEANKRSMAEAYFEVFESLESDVDYSNVIQELSNNYGLMGTIVDDEMRIIYTSAPHLKSVPNNRVPPEIGQMVHELILSHQPHTFNEIEMNNNEKAILFAGVLPEKHFILFDKSERVIVESSDLLYRFINIAVIATLAIGSVMVYWLSGRLTKPIVEMNAVAMNIAKLRFDDELTIKSKDEVGTLATSINTISKELSSSLDELHEANAQLHKDIEYEKTMDKLRRKFVSSVSHEFKTPISMIQGYAEGLKFNIAKSKEDRDYYCDVIIEETDKMNRLIHDLLDLSSYEAGQFRIQPKQFDLAQLMQDSVEKFNWQIREKQVLLHTEMLSEALVMADLMRMEQVVTNYMSNALKHVPVGGEMRLLLEKAEGGYRIGIYNSGNPILENELENIWTSFYKLDSSNERVLEGTGLGLAIVKAIMELHHGKWGAANKEKGVEFWVFVPKGQ